MIKPFRFSTDDLPLSERGNAVCELRERGILPIEPLRDRVLRVQIAKWFLPGTGILSGALCGVRQDGTLQAGGDDLFFAVNLAGRSTVFQRDREITLEDRDAILLNCAVGPFTIARPTPARFVGLRVPRKTISPLVIDLDDQMMRVVLGETDALKLLTNYVSAIVNIRSLASPEISHLVVTHLHDLIALSLDATRDAAAVAEGRGVRAARLQAIKSDIVANLEDCTLTIDTIAARHRITPRYVHKLFESEGITYTQFVLRQRLERAYRMLRNPRLAARSIGSIAYDAGFGDLSYFNRTFRRHYNATPSDIRNSGSI